MEIHSLTVLGTRSLKSSVGRTGSFGVMKEKSSLPASGSLQAMLGFCFMLPVHSPYFNRTTS